MGYKICTIGQKGGPGKSAIARTIATCYASAEWDVKIADLDINQSTSFEWLQRRLQNNIEPVVAVEAFGSAMQAIKQSENYDLFIFDGAPTASRETKEIAKQSDLIIIPTGLGVDDLKPSVMIAHNLAKEGVGKERICFVFNKATGSISEFQESRAYLLDTPYFLIDGRIEFKPCYRQALDAGLSLTETRYKAPREKADYVMQNIIDRLEKVTQE
ncbi:ParA family protein [Pseudoalteromonas sp. Of7M-16]|uniref:ParA family protein n=1 Tax=Pseudoalteromonas sp. Of7M-16 TaxID=2917756 RepID=UPI001EF6E06B|nr:ParA family protein [Pseudoalteromonas sp. Of7M-16]MCG7551598.1 ParA family protein [Pseudoalteromonas sp. Of7M-16]